MLSIHSEKSLNVYVYNRLLKYRCFYYSAGDGYLGVLLLGLAAATVVPHDSCCTSAAAVSQGELRLLASSVATGV